MMAKTIEEPLDERVRRMAKDFPFNGYVSVKAIEFAHLLDTRDKHIRTLEAELEKVRSGLRAQTLIEFMAGEDIAIQIYKKFDALEADLAASKAQSAQLAAALEHYRHAVTWYQEYDRERNMRIGTDDNGVIARAALTAWQQSNK
jgi:hypothetical protein